MNNQFVKNMLSSNANPLVAITIVGGYVPMKGYQLYRFMGAVVESFPAGLRLVATCRHFLVHLEAGMQLYLAYMNPDFQSLEVMGEPILDPNSENDVCFLLVRDPKDAPTQPFVLTEQDPEVVGEVILFNAANKCEPFHDYYEIYVARQCPVTEIDTWAFCKLSDLVTNVVLKSDVEKQVDLIKEGWVAASNVPNG